MDKATYEASVYGAIFDALMGSRDVSKLSVRTTRPATVSTYLYTKPLNDFGLVMDATARYWLDDDSRAEVEVTGITYRSADCRHEQDMPLSLFSEDALAELRDEIAGEIECEQDDAWLARDGQ